MLRQARLVRQQEDGIWSVDPAPAHSSGRQHIFRQGIDQVQPELLIGGDHDYSLPRLTPDGGEILYLQMPGRDEACAAQVRLRRL